MRRRDLAGIVFTPSVLAAMQHAHEAATKPGAAKLTHFDAATAAEVEALAAQIVPADGTPGAREAGVVYFIDRALGTFDQELQPAYRDGLSKVQEKRKELFPASVSIASLSDADAVRLVQAIENTEFFAILRAHTLMGFLGNPSYGSNREGVGWKLIGFEDRHVFTPPFGWYDEPKNGALR